MCLYYVKIKNPRFSVDCLLRRLTASTAGEEPGPPARLSECATVSNPAETSHRSFVLLKSFPVFLPQCFKRKKYLIYLKKKKNPVIQSRSLSQRPKTNLTVERCNEDIKGQPRDASLTFCEEEWPRGGLASDRPSLSKGNRLQGNSGDEG